MTASWRCTFDADHFTISGCQFARMFDGIEINTTVTGQSLIVSDCTFASSDGTTAGLDQTTHISYNIGSTANRVDNLQVSDCSFVGTFSTSNQSIAVLLQA